ncbi:hypothetical protein NQ652_09300 [Acinetobacter baumannii]|nr:hypothetical protein [Acinetobacter baumannii]
MSQIKNIEIEQLFHDLDNLITVIENNSESLVQPEPAHDNDIVYSLSSFIDEYKFISTHGDIYFNFYVEEDLLNKVKILEKLKKELNIIVQKITAKRTVEVIPEHLSFYVRNYKNYIYSIEFTPERQNQDYLKKIFDYIKNLYNEFDHTNMLYNYINQGDYDSLIIKKFFDLFKILITDKRNSTVNYLQYGNLEREIYDYIYNEKIQKLNNEIDNLTTLSKDVREKIGLIEDQKLIFAHQNFSKDQDSPICKLSWAINCIFIFIIGSLIYLFYHLTEAKIEFNWKNYVFYLSIYITLTGYLTYLIKERVRLINIKNYCDKTWLEITALSAYMVEFKQEEVVKLKMQLADKYFAGPNNDSSNIKELNPELTTSLIMELLKSGKDQSSK